MPETDTTITAMTVLAPVIEIQIEPDEFIRFRGIDHQVFLQIGVVYPPLGVTLRATLEKDDDGDWVLNEYQVVE